MGALFHQLLYRPLFNTLLFFYQTIAFHDAGVAIILLTIAIRTLLYPLFYKTFKQQTILQRLQPEIQKIQESHKHDKELQAKAILALYEEHRVNPFSSFFLLFLQLPILIALYQVFLAGFSAKTFVDVYSFLTPPAEVHPSFLGLLNLGEKSIIMVALSAIAQYIQGKLALVKGAPTAQARKIGQYTLFIGPIITVLILQSLPSAVTLYWLTTTLFSVGQQIVINKKIETDPAFHSHGTASGTTKDHHRITQS